MPGRLRAVLVDYFGTLTQAFHRGAWHRQMARSLGCDPDEWLDLLSRTFYQRATGRLGDPVDVLRRMAEALGADPDPAALDRVWGDRVSMTEDDAPLRPEAVPALRAIRALGLRTALVSDCWYELPLLLPTQPVFPLLDAQVYSVEAGCCKPDPAMYRTACDRLSVRPEECLYIGDGDSRELTGAAALGMTVVRLAAPDLGGHLSFNPDVEFSGPAVTTLTDLIPLVYRDRAPMLTCDLKPRSALPSAPVLPALSALPSVSALPAVPALPSVSALPAVPALPALPALPSVSALPAVPALPALPSVSALPALPGPSGSVRRSGPGRP
jgi:putative hydrolase of the HAD superfamily